MISDSLCVALRDVPLYRNGRVSSTENPVNPSGDVVNTAGIPSRNRAGLEDIVEVEEIDDDEPEVAIRQLPVGNPKAQETVPIRHVISAVRESSSKR